VAKAAKAVAAMLVVAPMSLPLATMGQGTAAHTRRSSWWPRQDERTQRQQQPQKQGQKEERRRARHGLCVLSWAPHRFPNPALVQCVCPTRPFPSRTALCSALIVLWLAT